MQRFRTAVHFPQVTVETYTISWWNESARGKKKKKKGTVQCALSVIKGLSFIN